LYLFFSPKTKKQNGLYYIIVFLQFLYKLTKILYLCGQIILLIANLFFMECLCKIKTVFKKIHEFEQNLQTMHNVTINEAMVICCLSETKKSSGGIAKETEISLSRTSRVLLSLEQKGYIKRSLGDKDKRQMMFVLSASGKIKLAEINSLNVDINLEI